ncbi:MAG: division/cell wall cluster transcriptional repressor MraZ [Pseudodesulfovibrio sp.]|uniref:Transcriptional regulator MraZ n=1 Tax=Pseudodesulfovibrio aespoeensis (strain ATCC 700646 / DSM 10631 / Aspo-2) TaxID=643562 RepID=E6VXF1_PSEA9|nr:MULTISPECIES: cell division protein MraZ [Pseudodesulfovibrio]MBU4191574.1 division/cell wall cluster transcriptional repressor MraZ [Pseudomonadota bacterium]ADU63767.1 MraZ domain protein [Pseudodesulfovibrio aespoeensis Aspo-2]MBU4244829.1 division/cell wall cluster transcriptional repressor MraZ [Pseudomonadota bacterium]MBU4379703.1 division/cell wall cluster transcriptional repressor MraZ [Pseudomonadota bacterium]MBU4475683.1 division/cell wall cluster transcriptional repressor MraZ 
MKFRGHAHRSLDDKGRLILPPDFRDMIRSGVPESVIVLTIFDRHVIGITPAQWARMEDELEKVKTPSRELQNTIRILYSGYTETPVGAQGRIAIPAHLRKSGKLDKDVVVMGAGRRFEIWPADSFERLLDEDYDVSQELAENNVSLPF